MKNSIRHVLGLVMAASVFAGASSVVRSESAPPSEAYVQAVNDYVDAAAKETGSFREELEKNETLGKKAAWASVRDSLKRCQALIDQLKNAPASQFDPIKAKYEAARADLKSRLAAARQS